MTDKKILPIVGIAFLVLMGIVLVAYQYSRPRGGAIVLPGGVTYLGPSPTRQPTPSVERFFADASVPWTEQKGSLYTYAFSAPETLPITPFLKDTYDAYAITWKGADPGTNVLIGVEDLKKDEKRTMYVNKKKKDYIESFWARQYNLIGVEKIEEFTNGKGLKGYKVTFKTTTGVSPYDDAFFEVPDKPNLVIHLSNAILDPAVFEKILESVSWTSQ